MGRCQAAEECAIRKYDIFITDKIKKQVVKVKYEGDSIRARFIRTKK